MKMTNSKHRKFWIEFGGDPSKDGECYKRYCATSPFKTVFPDSEVIETIETSALTEALALVDELQKSLEFYGSENSWCRFEHCIRHDIIHPSDVNDSELDYKGKVFAGNKARETLASTADRVKALKESLG